MDDQDSNKSNQEQKTTANPEQLSGQKQPKKKRIDLSRTQIIAAIVIIAALLAVSVGAFFYLQETADLGNPLLKEESENEKIEQESEVKEEKATNLYESESLNLSFERPDKWKVLEDSGSVSITSPDYKKKSGAFDGANPAAGAIVRIRTYENSNGDDIDDIVEQDAGARDYSKQPENSDGGLKSYPLKDIKKITVAGKSVRQYLWAYEGSYLHTVLITDDNKILAIDLDVATDQTAKKETIEFFSEYQDEYDQITSTLKLL